jgi:hypothetical protein
MGRAPGQHAPAGRSADNHHRLLAARLLIALGLTLVVLAIAWSAGNCASYRPQSLINVLSGRR